MVWKSPPGHLSQKTLADLRCEFVSDIEMLTAHGTNSRLSMLALLVEHVKRMMIYV
jgi:hypothetical protein